MCVDYRRLNSVTKFDCFLLPRLDEALESFAGATVFSSLDLAMTHHQVPVKPSDIEKTAFITHVNLYKMVKMPFGLCNSPSTYKRLMSNVLQGLIGRICLAYLDDIIVFSKKRSNHISDFCSVFNRISSAGLKLKPTKLRVLADWPSPSTVREMQSLFGFVNFYNDYIADSTALISALYDLTANQKGEDRI